MATEDLLTPTRVSAWLGCAHTLTLTKQYEADGEDLPTGAFGSFATLLQEKGEFHERAHLEQLRADGHVVVEAPPRATDESFAAWASRSHDLLAEGHDVLYQVPLVHDGMRGIADFLVRVDRASTLGPFSYEPVDAKLARSQAKPGHVLQLCFYADALESLQGVRPRQAHLALGSGQRESIVLATVDAYWRRVKGQLAKALLERPETVARPCSHCELCVFKADCTEEWRSNDVLHFVAGIRSSEIEVLEPAGIATLSALASSDGPVEGLRDARVAYLRRQAALQQARASDGPPPFELIERAPEGSPEELAARLPEPDDGDVFLDLEGHPFWRADVGLFFLFGALVRDPASTDGWSYLAWWAHDQESEALAVTELVTWLTERRLEHPSMHVYHYNHTERSQLASLADRYGARPAALTELIDRGVFVDLLEVVRHTVQIGAESYSLKQVELVVGYERGHEIDAGAGAVVGYERWLRDGDQAELDAIARYNEDDVRATLAVRGWLLDQVLRGVEARPEPQPEDREPRAIDEVVTALIATGVEWHALLAHLLDYWAREWRTVSTQALAQLEGEERDLMRRPAVVAGLELIGTPTTTGRQVHPTAVFRYPEQRIQGRLRAGGSDMVLFPAGEGLPPVMLSVRDHDLQARELSVAWKPEAGDAAFAPAAMATVSHVFARPKPARLLEFAQRVLDGATSPADAVRIALLERALPRFVSDGAGGSGGAQGFPVDPAALAAVVAELDASALAVQGPPGTGKTYTGARVISILVARGERIGITAFSHAAIDNLVREVLSVDPSIRVLRQASKGRERPADMPGVTFVDDTVASWDPAKYDIVAATTWQFARLAAADAPALDLLVIDEAGQLGLADATVAVGSSRNALLLGDPLQLAQVTQAVHPLGSGLSTLEHVLGDAATMPAERGVFLPTTRRMHPRITRFLTEQIYDGRLESDPACAQHGVDGQAGIRWLRVEHTGRSSESPEEAAAVVTLARSLIGSAWTDSRHMSEGIGYAPLPAEQIMVVAPYNDQVDLIRRDLDADPITRGVRVGTVDRLQGQEAAVVIFSMATSSEADLTRRVDFLFSRNRLNVAISRARALAYVVCTDELLNTRAKDVETMQLIGTLCALVEAAESADQSEA